MAQAPSRPALAPLKQVQAILILAQASFLLTAAACSDSNPSTERDPSAAFDGNLWLVTLDTTRADRLGCYGHGAARTPRLDALANSGIRFDRAYAHAPITLPTHASLFTGTFPPEHGIHDNGRVALGGDLTTLAEVFRAKGYRTGAFVSAIALDGSFGLDRGFQIYDDRLGQPRQAGQRVLDRPASEVVDAALEWLDRDTGPFFLWTHFYDPHAAYEPPVEHRLPDAYDGEVAYVDAQIGRLVDWLGSRDRLESTLIVAIADHGESLGEKGEQTHASLIYEGTQRIPWIMNSPGRISPGQVSTELVQQVDFLPTLMEFYDWSVPEAVSGRSLVPLLRGEQLEARPIFMESEYAALNFGWSSLRGLVDGPWKYIQAPTPELYNLVEDPGELTNLAGERDELVRQLDDKLTALLASMGSYAVANAEVDAQMSEGLSDLGYVQGGTASGQSGEANTSSINPMERIEYLELYHGAVGLANQGRFEEMVAPLERVVEACPEGAGFRALLGDTYRRLERWEDARAQLKKALEISPNYDPAHFYFGIYYELRSEIDAALASYRENLRIRPEYVPAREAVARLLFGRGDIEEALSEYERIVEYDPNQSRHWVTRANLEGMLGKSQARRESMEQALAVSANDLDARDFCAWVLASSSDEILRDGAKALAIAEANVERTRRQVPRFLDTLAAAHACLGDFDEAIEVAEEAKSLAESAGDKNLAQEVAAHLASYRAGEALREN